MSETPAEQPVQTDAPEPVQPQTVDTNDHLDPVEMSPTQDLEGKPLDGNSFYEGDVEDSKAVDPNAEEGRPPGQEYDENSDAEPDFDAEERDEA